MFTRESRALMIAPQPTTPSHGQIIGTRIAPPEDSKQKQTSPKSPGRLQIRSTRGCWTCRLRKKKCDEIQPHCQRCTSVNINCYFGQKPLWIEDRRLGKEELERIKPTIAASASRKRAVFREKSKLLGAQISPGGFGTGMLEKEYSYGKRKSSGDDEGLEVMDVSYESAVDGEDGKGNERERHDALPAIYGSSSLVDTISPGGVRYDQKSPIVAAHQSKVEVSNAKDFSGNEDNLMMHYLDNVFYIQFRFFTPSIRAGGRGWLLSLLNRTKPLYHAAISLSAFHQQSLISQDTDQAQMDYLHQLELHHNLTLEELQLFIHAHTERTSLGGGFGGKVQILACMVQLISFELFNGGTGKWQVHLGAASKLILELQSMRVEKSSSCSPQDLAQAMDKKDVSRPNIAAFDFFTSAIIWFDIVACVSTGSQPHLAEHHHSLLTQSSSTSEDDLTFQLERIMGCQNWVMIIIGEIATLAHAHQEGDLDTKQFTSTVKDIQDRLEYHNSQTCSSLQSLQHEYCGVPPHYLSSIYTHYTTLVVTHIFACAAIIYLQTVNTAPTIFNIKEPLQAVISAMSSIPDPRMVRGMVWPLCVAGCMASSPADQNFFREKAEDAVRDAGMVGNSGKVMEILEMSWELQRIEGRLVDCATCVRKLGTCVLLA